MRYSSYSFTTSALDGVSGQRHAPAALKPREKESESESRPALRPTQPPVQWAPGDLTHGETSDRGVTLTTHPHLVPRT
jgi:hypothetical protein